MSRFLPSSVIVLCWSLCLLGHGLVVQRAVAQEAASPVPIRWLPIGDSSDTRFSVASSDLICFSPDDESIFVGWRNGSGVLWMKEEGQFIEYGTEPAAGPNLAQPRSNALGTKVHDHRKQYFSRNLNAFRLLALLDDSMVAYINESRLGGPQIVQLPHDNNEKNVHRISERGIGFHLGTNHLDAQLCNGDSIALWEAGGKKGSRYLNLDAKTLKTNFITTLYDGPRYFSVGRTRTVSAFFFPEQNACLFEMPDPKDKREQQQTEFRSPEGLKLVDSSLEPFFVNGDQWLAVAVWSTDFRGLVFVDVQTGEIASRLGATHGIVKAASNRDGTVLALATDFPKTLLVARWRDGEFVPVWEQPTEDIGLVHHSRNWELSSSGREIALVDADTGRVGLLDLSVRLESSPSAPGEATAAEGAFTLDDYRAEDIPFASRREYHPEELVHRFDALEPSDGFEVDPTGRWLAVGFKGDTFLLDTTRQPLHSLKHLLERAGLPKWKHPVGGFLLSADGHSLFTASSRAAGVWDLTDSGPRLVAIGERSKDDYFEGLFELAAAGEASRYVLGTREGFSIWELQDEVLRELTSIADSGPPVAVSSASDAVYTLGSDRALREYALNGDRPPTGKRLLKIPPANGQYRPRLYSSTLSQMWGWDDEELFVWSFDGAKISEPVVHRMSGDIEGLWPSAGNQHYLVSVRENGSDIRHLQIRDEKWRSLGTVEIPGSIERAAAFRDARHVLVNVDPQNGSGHELWLLRPTLHEPVDDLAAAKAGNEAGVGSNKGAQLPEGNGLAAAPPSSGKSATPGEESDAEKLTKRFIALTRRINEIGEKDQARKLSILQQMVDFQRSLAKAQSRGELSAADASRKTADKLDELLAEPDR